ncbi:hypothetical protein CO019_01175 [Candidatus Berkelbacteria bacterium CG_4_9_14_0_2_um_filter_42_30]|uniref:Uncharacterized protein n=1 Tax=Candidatus Berkelbacteria bacterium CG_4_9_14_0_2_um_filter_42_30 TaxID=1974506 RepID=A0A2M8G2M1_9BACT|nr:MAG: hypothetical protein CO019_01175 [Candidatus Berkelbacteria bacterium CG_4_9_14_0_2_um_filter_42_30]
MDPINDTTTQKQNVSNQNATSGKGKNVIEGMYGELLEKDILELMGVDNLPDKEKEELYKKMLETILNRVVLRLDTQISDEEVEKLKEITDKKDKEGFFKFFQDKGIDIKSIFAEEAALYKVEMVALTSQGGTNG